MPCCVLNVRCCFFVLFFERQPAGDGLREFEWLSNHTHMCWYDFRNWEGCLLFVSLKCEMLKSGVGLEARWTLLSTAKSNTLNPVTRHPSVFLSCTPSCAVFCAHGKTSPAVRTQNTRLQLYHNQCQVPKLSSNKCVFQKRTVFFFLSLSWCICKRERPHIRWQLNVTEDLLDALANEKKFCQWQYWVSIFSTIC